MSDFSEEEDIDISESELEEYADSRYVLWKKSCHNFRVSDDAYKCPYCREKQTFGFKDLFQHAAGVSQASGTRKVIDRGRHLGLKKYLQEIDGGKSSSSQSEMDDRALHDSCDMNELYVWPWMGILANVPVQWKDDHYVGESGSKLTDLLTREGFNPLRVHPLWNFKSHSGYAIVEFKREWLGILDALRFEKAYEEKHQGSREYHGAKEKGEKLYGWVARAGDYHSDNVVGDYLQKKGDLKTIAQCQKEEHIKESKLLQFTNTIDVQNMRLKEMEDKYKEASMSLSSLINQKYEMIREFNEERRKQRQRDTDELKRIFQEQDGITMELLAQRKKLEEEEQELKKREAQNDLENLLLYYERKQENEKATLERKRANEKMLILAEDLKKEKELLQRKAIDLERKLDSKPALELEIGQLRRRLELEENLAKLLATRQGLEEKEEDLETRNSHLFLKEYKSNDELQEARKELINALKDQSAQATIGVKRMGELNCRAFFPAAKRMNSGKEIVVKLHELYTHWEDRIRDSNWHPFKVIPIEGGKNYKTIPNEEDEELIKLKNECGNEAYDAVLEALMEMNEYNPNGMYLSKELWNLKDNRRARLREGIAHLIKQWNTLKNKRR